MSAGFAFRFFFTTFFLAAFLTVFLAGLLLVAFFLGITSPCVDRFFPSEQPQFVGLAQARHHYP
jgi:hypothetical protein